MIAYVFRLTAFAVACAFTLAAGAAPRAEHVFIISIDGGAPYVIEQSSMPVLKKLVVQGAHTWTAQTIRPSITLPSHTSMLTGVGVEKHGMTWNDWEPAKGVVHVPTIFAAVKKDGLSTAMFVGKEKFRHLLQPGTVDEFDYDRAHSVIVMKSASGDSIKEKEGNVLAKIVATNAANYILQHKPDLCFIHLTDPDTFGHEFGWGSLEQIGSFADVDAALGVVVKAIHDAGIAERSVILITADHGGHGEGHSQGSPLDMHIPWIAWGVGVKQGFEITAPVNTCDTAATALWLLNVQPLSPLDGTPVFSAFESDGRVARHQTTEASAREFSTDTVRGSSQTSRETPR